MSASSSHGGARFWALVALAGGSAMLLAITLIWPEWIELVGGVDPDHGSGWLEWAVVFIAITMTVVGSVGARFEWRARRVAPAGADAS